MIFRSHRASEIDRTSSHMCVDIHAAWEDDPGHPEGWDKDSWSANDNMGLGTPSDDGGESSSFSVTNQNGNLFGPNGERAGAIRATPIGMALQTQREGRVRS